MYSFQVHYVCGKLTLVHKCFECSMYELKLIHETDIENVSDSLKN